MRGTIDEGDRIRRLAGGALNLFVALVADEQDPVALVGESSGLVVHLGHQRTGGVDGAQVTRRRLLVHGRCHSVGAEDHDGTLGDLVSLLDEDGPTALEPRDHMTVVNDLAPNVDRGTVELEGLLDGDHRALDPGAESTGGCQEHLLGSTGKSRIDHRHIRESAVGVGHGTIVGGRGHVGPFS